MSDILDTARFDAGVNTPRGREQFSFVKTAGRLIGNHEYSEGFDKFEQGCPGGDAYIWKVLSAAGDKAGSVLYENVKNYIDYVSNVDVCKVQSLRSMVKAYGLEYKVFDRLDLLPAEVLDLLNIFSISKKYVLYGNTVLDDYRRELSAAGAVYDWPAPPPEGTSATVVSSVVDFGYPPSGRYYDFVADSFAAVISGFLCAPYEEGGEPIYSMQGEDGVYDEIQGRRSRYMQQFAEGTEEYDRRRYKMLNGVPLTFDEAAALDGIEAGAALESDYSGAEAELVKMEKERRARSPKGKGFGKTSRYAFYKRRRVMEYAEFVTNKYYTDHRPDNLGVYGYDPAYFEIPQLSADLTDNPDVRYRTAGSGVVYADGEGRIRLDDEMIRDVARALADTAFYIERLREKVRLQTRKNYMKGTYDLMLYAVNEFLVEYSRTNPIFRSAESADGFAVSALLSSVYSDLSSHDVGSLEAVEYFDATEYYNIRTGTDWRSDMIGTNDRFWEFPEGTAPLTRRDGADPDFDAESITSFYMDTLGIRDNYISDETSLSAFLGAVFGLGAVDSFVH